MAKQRIIRTVMWSDPFFIDLPALEKLLFIYLITNERVNICGIYEISMKTIILETDLEKEFIEKSLEKFSACGKIERKDRWIVVLNFMKHQNIKSPKIIAAITRELSEMPEKMIRYISEKDTVSHFTLPNGVTLPKGLTLPNPTEKSDVRDLVSYLGSVSFGMFWDNYPKKECQEPAREIWMHSIEGNDDLIDAITEAVEWQKKSGCLKVYQYSPKPGDWLKAKRWNDERPPKPEDRSTSVITL